MRLLTLKSLKTFGSLGAPQWGTPNKHSLFEKIKKRTDIFTTFTNASRLNKQGGIEYDLIYLEKLRFPLWGTTVPLVPPAARAIETSGALRTNEVCLSNVTCNVEHIWQRHVTIKLTL